MTSAVAEDSPQQCGLQVTSYRNWKILRSDDLLVFTSGMAIDADGSPHAYHPDNVSGLDDLRHAGSAPWWNGLAKDNGVPVVQGVNDPAPNFYVSSTSLENQDFPGTSPSHYVDAEKIPYVALPEDLDGPELGDVAFVYNADNDQASAAIFADESPRPGEGSIALARAIGVEDDARYGGAENGITFVVFLNSGDQKPLTQAEIERRGNELRKKLGVDELLDCVSGTEQAKAGTKIEVGQEE